MRRVEAAIEVCEQHLDASGARNTEIEAYLTRYLLILIRDEYDREIDRLVAAKAASFGHGHAGSFVQSATWNVLRGIGIGELGKYLARFDGATRTAFRSSIIGTDSQRAYESVLANRKDTAHGPGSTMTFNELKQAFADSRKVLEAFGEALGVA